MRNITLNFEVAARSKKDGTYPIYLRITENSNHLKQVLDVSVTNRKNFNAQAKKESWISKETYAKLFNSKLALIWESTHKIMIELERREELSAINLMKQLKSGANSKSFIEFLDKKRQERIDNREYSYADSFFYLKQKLLVYTKNKDILFRDLTHLFVSEFVLYLKKEGGRTKGILQSSTIHILLSRFKTIYKEAVIEEYIINQSNPFDRITIKKNKPMRIALTEEEIERINVLDLKYDSQLWHSRNYFMFSMYLAGIRIGDLMELKWKDIDNNRLVYTMQKTKSHCSLIIHEKAQNILDLYKKESNQPNDYIFPILTKYETNKKDKKDSTSSEIKKRSQKGSRTADINRQLKMLVKKAAITKNISFHCLRHRKNHYSLSVN